MYDLRQLFKDLGCINAIHLDGSGSARMQVYANNATIKDRGSDPDRYAWNMVRLNSTT
ncbi:phosphodiester glycosidase family protein [Paenibacillus harenae]|uniref:phosphodiester glycosidase family protein n=1 Tax=Paenibacillus harenae TaxID=306543 RepID=UPI003593DCA4